jgi:phage shock protein PspC (stress-responsive transcriptional regulator)
MKDLCASTVTALAALVERAEAPSEEQLAHWRSCPRCQALVEAARQQLAALSATLETAADREGGSSLSRAAAAAIVEGEKRQRELTRRNALLIVVGWALLSAAAGTTIDRSWFGGGSFAAAAVGIGMILGFTAALAAAAVTLLRLPAHYGFYKRPRPGYWISGVCEGLSEKLSVPAWLLRAGFVALEVFLRVGVLFYVVLSLSMPVHPEDRRHLLGFRVARWWRRIRGVEPAGV